MKTIWGREAGDGDRPITMVSGADNLECTILATALFGARGSAKDLLALLNYEEISRLQQAAAWLAGEAAVIGIQIGIREASDGVDAGE